jgi:hypothetical protein
MPDLDNKQVDLDVTGPAMDVDIDRRTRPGRS